MNPVKLNVFYSEIAKEKIAGLSAVLKIKIQNYFDELSRQPDGLSKNYPKNTEILVNGFFQFRLNSKYRIIYNVENDSIFVTDLINYDVIDGNLASDLKPIENLINIGSKNANEKRNRHLDIEKDISALEKVLHNTTPTEKTNYNSFTLVALTTLLIAITNFLFSPSLRSIFQLLAPIFAFITYKVFSDYIKYLKQKRFEVTIKKMIEQLNAEKNFK